MEFNKLVPELTVTDLSKSLEFYVGILGFKVEYDRKEFAYLSFEGSQIMLDASEPGDWGTGTLEHPYGRGINLQIEAQDVDALVQSLEAKEYPLKIGTEEHWYRKDNVLLGAKEFLVLDPDGYLLRFAEDLGEKPAV